MTRTLSSVLIFVSILFSTGCSEHPCAEAEIRYRLIGFSDTEAATFTIRKFAKGGVTATDSILVNASNPVGYQRFGDTLVMSTYSPSILLESKFDYELFFPLAASTIRITEIEEPPQYRQNRLFNNTKENCYNSISGCRINGQLFSPVGFANTIYIHK